MARINLGGGLWFNPEAAECFGEDTRWDGNNHISLATGSQWEHEELYRTRKGLFILHRWSQWQGSTPSYETVEDETAQQWLIDNDHAAAVDRFFPQALDAAEV